MKKTSQVIVGLVYFFTVDPEGISIEIDYMPIKAFRVDTHDASVTLSRVSRRKKGAWQVGKRKYR